MNSKEEIEVLPEVPKVWIGLSECDEERERRTETAKSLFGQLEIDRALLGWAYDLFLEALSCYQNGALLASTMACRSATEAALYTCVTRREGKVFSAEWEGMEPSERLIMTVDMNYIDSKFGEFICQAKTLGLIDTKLEGRLTSVRTWGNLGAHYVSTVDKRVFRSMENTKEEDSQPAPTGLWPTVSDAEPVLRESVDIVNVLRRNYYKVKPKT